MLFTLLSIFFLPFFICEKIVFSLFFFCLVDKYYLSIYIYDIDNRSYQEEQNSSLQ